MSNRLKVLNALSAELYNDAHIKNSLSVPLDELKTFAEHTPKDTAIVVYCAHRNCDVSARAWHILHELGFDNLFAYEGGMREWYEAGYPTDGPCNADYLHEPLGPQANHDHAVQSITKELLKARMEREGLL
jgi:rhodanese-related sulfurtransferase